MVNSSPEYTITKPGMNPHERKRGKPLRTYSKRDASTAESTAEPPTKKRRVESTAPQTSRLSSPDTIVVATSPVAEAQKDVPALVKSTAGGVQGASILRYFKPVASSPRPSPKQPTQLPKPSPPMPKARRKPRLLRFRANASKEEPDTSEDEKSKDTAGSPRDPLQDRGDSLHNQQPGSLDSESHESTKARPPKRTVQTTLNISAQAAFSECSICDTVWNPLYPDDVKYHSKRHASVLRAQRKKIEAEL